MDETVYSSLRGKLQRTRVDVSADIQEKIAESIHQSVKGFYTHWEAKNPSGAHSYNQFADDYRDQIISLPVNFSHNDIHLRTVGDASTFLMRNQYGHMLDASNGINGDIDNASNYSVGFLENVTKYQGGGFVNFIQDRMRNANTEFFHRDMGEKATQFGALGAGADERMSELHTLGGGETPFMSGAGWRAGQKAAGSTRFQNAASIAFSGNDHPDLYTQVMTAMEGMSQQQISDLADLAENSGWIGFNFPSQGEVKLLGGLRPTNDVVTSPTAWLSGFLDNMKEGVFERAFNSNDIPTGLFIDTDMNQGKAFRTQKNGSVGLGNIYSSQSYDQYTNTHQNSAKPNIAPYSLTVPDVQAYLDHGFAERSDLEARSHTQKLSPIQQQRLAKLNQFDGIINDVNNRVFQGSTAVNIENSPDNLSLFERQYGERQDRNNIPLPALDPGESENFPGVKTSYNSAGLIMLTYKTGHVSPAGIAREARVRAEAKARGVEVAPIINREFTPAVEKDFNGEPYLPVAQARRRSGTPQGKDFRSVPNAGGIELAPDGGVEIGSIGNARGIIDTANPGTPLGENPEETIPIVSKVIKTKPSISSDYEELTPEQNKTVEKWIGEEDPDNLLPENYDISNRLLALKEVNLKLSKSSKLNKISVFDEPQSVRTVETHASELAGLGDKSHRIRKSKFPKTETAIRVAMNTEGMIQPSDVGNTKRKEDWSGYGYKRTPRPYEFSGEEGDDVYTEKYNNMDADGKDSVAYFSERGEFRDRTTMRGVIDRVEKSHASDVGSMSGDDINVLLDASSHISQDEIDNMLGVAPEQITARVAARPAVAKRQKYGFDETKFPVPRVDKSTTKAEREHIAENKYLVGQASDQMFDKSLLTKDPNSLTADDRSKITAHWDRVNEETDHREAEIKVSAGHNGGGSADGGLGISNRKSVEENASQWARSRRYETQLRELHGNPANFQRSLTTSIRDAGMNIQLRDIVGNENNGGKGFYDTTYGNAKQHIDADGNVTYNVEHADGTQSISHDKVQTGYGIAQSALQNTSMEGLPSNQTDAVLTANARVKASVNKMIDNYVTDIVKESDGSAGAKAQAAVVGEAAKTAANNFIKQAFQRVDENLSGTSDYKSGASSANFHARKISDVKEIEGLLTSNPELASRVGNQSPADLKAGLLQNFGITNADGTMGVVSFGGDNYGGGSSSGGNKSGGMWNGGMGKAMYGMYLAKRFYGMTVGPMQQASDQYDKYANQYQSIADIGVSGVNMASTQGGGIGRQNAIDEYGARTANQVLGGGQQMQYVMSGMGDAPGRLGTYGTVAAEAAFGSQFAAGMLPTEMLTKLGGAGAITGAGTTIGLGVAGIAVASEAFNMASNANNGWNYFGRDPVTPKNLGTTAAQAFSIVDAASRVQTHVTDYASFNKWANGPILSMMNGDKTAAQSIYDNMTPEEKATAKYSGNDPTVDRIRSLSGLLSAGTGVDTASTDASIRTLYQANRNVSENYIEGVIGNANRLGVGGALVPGAASYASTMGYEVGSTRYQSSMDSYMNSTDVASMGRKDYSAGRIAQLGSSLDATMDLSSYKEGTAAVRDLGLNPQQAGTALGYMSAGQQFGQVMSPHYSGVYAQRTNSYVGNVISSYSQLAGLAGMNVSDFQDSMSGAGITSMQAYGMSNALSDPVGTLSYLANTGQMGVGSQWATQDMSGQSYNQTNGSKMMASLKATIANSGGVSLMAGVAQSIGGGDTAKFLGTNDQAMIDAYNKDGMNGVGLLANQRSYDSSMASLGIQGAQINLQKQTLWGSGSATNPSSNSQWGIENQQVSNSYRAQQADFASQAQRMNISNSGAIAGENIQLSQMQLSKAQQSWSLNFNYANSLQQRSYTTGTEYQYQDTSRNEQYAWSEIDYKEAIRFSTGRQRRDLIRHEGQATTTYNQDTAEVKAGRTQQQVIWAEQDTQYKKEKQYETDLAKLNLDSFNLQKSQREQLFALDQSDYSRKKQEYQESFDLDAKARDLSRKSQVEGIKLSEASLGIQATQLQQSHEAETIVKTTGIWMDKWNGSLDTFIKNNPTFIIDAFSKMFMQMNNLNVSKLQALQDTMIKINSWNYIVNGPGG